MKKPDEASFSLQDVANSNGHRKYKLVIAVTDRSGASTWKSEADIPENDANVTSSSFVELSEPRELVEGEAVAVWTYVIHSDEQLLVSRPIDEAAKASRWALIVKMHWERLAG